MLLSTTFYYYVMQYYKLDPEKIFNYYLKGAVIVSYIGLFQFISYMVNFRPGYDYQWIFNKWGLVEGGFGIRLNSVFSEASQCGIMLGPACFVAVYNLIFRKKVFLKRHESIALLTALVLTTSSTGYLGLFIIAILITINYGQIVNLIFGVIMMIVLGNVLYNYIPEFKSRVDTSIGLWIEKDYSVTNVNSSSFVLYNNYHIAVENFKSNFLTGTGLGSHQIAFDKYTLTKRKEILDIKFNKADGNSMLLRLMSETGLIGLVFISLFITRLYVRRNPYDGEDRLWIVSNAVLVIILLYLLRQGNYFLNGFPLFMWLYYYTGVISKEIKVPDEHIVRNV
ncbi:MAG: hypothetical protein AB1458_12955 [Bacteroidota bacterium]